MERGEEEEEVAEVEEEEEGRRCAEGLEEGECSSMPPPPPLRFFTSPWCSKPLPLPCPCGPESPTPPRLWELLVAEEGSGGDEWPRGGCVRL